jgi:hypothetical protein
MDGERLLGIATTSDISAAVAEHKLPSDGLSSASRVRGRLVLVERTRSAAPQAAVVYCPDEFRLRRSILASGVAS